MTLPKGIQQVDCEIAEDGSLVLIGHTANDDVTFTATIEPQWWLDGEKVKSKQDAKVLTAFSSPSTPATSNFVPSK